MEQDPREDWAIQDHDHAPTYYKGHVAIIGDAAHATFPHAGNGAAQALEDCAILTGLFAHVKSPEYIKPALKAYDEVRRPRSQKVIDITRSFGLLYTQDPNNVDLAATLAVIQQGGKFTNGVDMEAQVKSAVDVFEGHKV